MKRTLQSLLILAFFLTANYSQAQLRIILVDSDNNQVWLKNFGTTSVDITGYRFAHKGNYPALTSLTLVGGGAIIGASNTRIISGFTFASHTVGSDVALFVPGSSSGDFTNPAKMVDFMQYGAAGNATESVAVSKGVWGAGTFVTGLPSFFYSGNGSTNNGVTFWAGNPNAVDENTLNNKVSVYPNPVSDLLHIDITNHNVINSYKLMNMVGEIVLESNNVKALNYFTIDVSNLASGNYSLQLISEGKVEIEKIIIN